ncbi:MAG TPA: Stk1 family PASTA domain-containing Ser/Thr kinase [Chloroflexia bacterium]|nr:Stk1 family PASTA domain-containing Ser/Thr kinase [Chloroflexia bacterium]
MTQARTLNNRYELQSKVGDGGMAAVYKALDLKLNRPVAIKILRDSYAADPQFLQRFKREAEQAASLNHPNIVRVFDVGDEGDLHYIVMEYVEGTNLKDLIMREAPFPTQRALEIGAEICDAISYAHSTGLIHRDIKPQNILIDRSGRVKVTDFGIAKSSNAATLTEAGITLGTVHYFSPEQAKGLQVLPQSDIYSIGVVLYEMLTGHIPFDSDNPVALALKHIEEPPPPLRRFNPNVPTAVEQIVLKTLSKNPQQRYASADQLARALRGIETQSEQGTMAVRPAPVPPNNGTSGTGYNNPRRPVTPPNGYTRAGYEDPGATYVQPVRPVQPARPVRPQPPVDYETYDNYPYDRQTGARRNGVRYYDERPSAAYRNRMPVEEQEYYEEEPRRSSGGCLPWFIGGAAFVMIVALALAAVFILPGLTTPKPTPTTGPTPPPATTAPVAKVKIPDVKNKSVKDATDLLTKANLQVGNTIEQNDTSVAPGNVIDTDPKIGTSVDVKSKINLIVSKGKETAPLYDYAKTNPDDAQKQLEQFGFKVQRVEEFSNDVQQGAVIRTDPQGGKDVTATKGSTIKLIVSKGPQPTNTPLPPTATPVPPTNTPAPAVKVTVPGVVGQKSADGQKAIANAGLVPKVIEWDENDIRQQFANDPAALANALQTYNQLKKGEILGTNPPGGSTADKNSEVIIAVKK